MKKLFQQIDDLCVTASIAGICSALQLDSEIRTRNGGCDWVTVKFGRTPHLLPGTTDPLWRRKWRKFLTDHVDEIANNLDAVAAAARDGQSG